MPLEPGTYALQAELARAVRTAGISESAEDRGVDIYRGLVRNVFDETLSRAYPISRRTLGEAAWGQMLDCFLSEHSAGSPELWRMPRELLTWIETADYGSRCQYPYLRDLLFFEWIEIEVFMMPDSLEEDWLQKVDEWAGFDGERVARINSDSRLISLSYPVFKPINKKFPPSAAQYFLIVFRHPSRLDACYIEASPFFALFWELLGSEKLTLSTAAAVCMDALAIQSTSELLLQCKTFCEMLHSEGLILGYKR